jgi:hypothetical protein
MDPFRPTFCPEVSSLMNGKRRQALQQHYIMGFASGRILSGPKNLNSCINQRSD